MPHPFHEGYDASPDADCPYTGDRWEAAAWWHGRETRERDEDHNAELNRKAS